MKKNLSKLVATVALMGCLGSCSSGSKTAQEWLLTEGWHVQSSAQISVDGKALSTQNIDPSKWYNATVPSTVMGVLTANGIYADAMEEMNYKKIDRKLFDTTWWYRTEFEIPVLKAGEFAALSFDGITYAANVWLNGELIATTETLHGPFRQFTFDVTNLLGARNILAVEVFRAQAGHFNIGFVDWNPRPADENMGIFREVRIQKTGSVSIQHPVVRSKVNKETLAEAWLSLETDLTNHSAQEVSGALKGSFEGGEFSYPVTLAAQSTQKVKLTSEQIAKFHLQNPRIWWCANMGSPEMYEMDLRFEVSGNVSDQVAIPFGVREISDYFTEENFRGFLLNGKKVLVRSAGWTDDIFLRDTPETNEIQIQYVADMNLNSIRFENIWGTSQNIYDLCDQYGLLALVGWTCHWEWENYLGAPCDENFGGILTQSDQLLMTESLNDQVLWLRNHPSIIAWYVGSDMLPLPELEQKYLACLAQIDDRPYVAAAKSKLSEVSGPSGMKMEGPYEYVGPEYWYDKNAPGGAFGFNTETGIGAQLPVLESLRKMIGEKNLWPMNEVWDYHCTTSANDMNTMKDLTASITARYGAPKDLNDYILKADLLNYEGTRAMFEAFRVNIPRATGIVQWMLNSAFPSIYWQLYDYYHIPTAAYYSTMRANSPQQLIYHYGNKKVIAVNEASNSRSLTATATMYNLSGKVLWNDSKPVTVDPYTTVETFQVPTVTEVSFLFLTLTDEKDVSKNEHNFYTLSPGKDSYNWAKTNWVRSPWNSLACYAELNDLAGASCHVQYSIKKEQCSTEVEVVLENQSPVVAFFMRLSLTDGNGELLKPVFWTDNYVSLAPGEKRTIRCKVPASSLTTSDIQLSVSGWNIKQNKYELNLEKQKL